MKNLIVRAVTGILFVAVMVTGICFRGDAMILLFALITGLTLWEYTGLVNEHVKDTSVNRFISTAAGVYLFLAFAGYCTDFVPSAAFIPYLLTVVYLFISELYLQQKNPIQNWAYTMLGQMYVALPFATINVLAFQADQTTGQVAYNWLLPMSIFIFLWTNDTGAYCVGSLFGKHRLFPRISPKKSWEGSIGGAVLVLIVAALISFFYSLIILLLTRSSILVFRFSFLATRYSFLVFRLRLAHFLWHILKFGCFGEGKGFVFVDNFL